MSPNPIWKRNSTLESQKMLLTQEQAYPFSKDVKLLNMPKFFGYIKSYNSSGPEPVESLNCQSICR